MGIDIYAHWHGETEAECEARFTGFSIAHGHVGYLREAYHGEPYATRVLVPEAFDDPNGAPIKAATMRERLPETLRTAIERQTKIYNEPAGSEETRLILKSFIDFVDLCARKERERGSPCTISASY